MKRVISLFCIITMIFIFTACNLFSESPEQAVSNALTAIKNSDKETMKKYFGDEDIFNRNEEKSQNEKETGGEEAEKNEKYLRLLVEKLDFEILSSNIEGDKATVKADITNTDMRPIFREYLRQAFSIAISESFLEGSEMSDEEAQEEMEQIFIDLLEDGDNKTITSTVEVNLSKLGNSWKTDADDKFLDAVFGGFFSIVDSIDDDKVKGSTDIEEIAEKEFIGLKEKTAFREWEYKTVDIDIHEAISDEKARGQYVVLIMEMTNNAKMPREVGGFFQAEDDKGNVYNFDSSVSLAYHHEYQTDTWHYEEIGPTFTVKLPIVFDVSKDAELIYLYPVDITEEDFDETKIIKISLSSEK